MNNELHAKTDQHVKEKKDTKIRLQDRIMRMKVKKTEKKKPSGKDQGLSVKQHKLSFIYH